MAEYPDGSATCDNCGALLPNAGVMYAVRVVGMAQDGRQVSLVLCTSGNRCASQVPGAPAWYDVTVGVG